MTEQDWQDVQTLRRLALIGVPSRVELADAAEAAWQRLEARHGSRPTAEEAERKEAEAWQRETWRQQRQARSKADEHEDRRQWEKGEQQDE